MFNQKKRTLAQFESSDDDLSAGGIQVIKRVKKRILKPSVLDDSSDDEANKKSFNKVSLEADEKPQPEPTD